MYLLPPFKNTVLMCRVLQGIVAEQAWLCLVLQPPLCFTSLHTHTQSRCYVHIQSWSAWLALCAVLASCASAKGYHANPNKFSALGLDNSLVG